MKHINESIIGRKGVYGKYPRCWDVLAMINNQHNPGIQPSGQQTCTAIYLDNRTARDRFDEIIDCLKIVNKTKTDYIVKTLKQCLAKNECIIVLYDLESKLYFWQHETMYVNALKSIPDTCYAFHVTKIIHHVTDNKKSIKEIFQDNNYFKDRL